jgi:AraC family transcriptional regulator, exoenzyme S synthesis regulatory protein ExsA
MSIPFFNVIDAVRSMPGSKIFEIGRITFAQFNCPGEQDTLVWTHTDYLLHVLTSKLAWKNAAGVSSARAGETVFFKKGAFIGPRHIEKDLCLEVFFIPDSVVRETVIELAESLPPVNALYNDREPTIRVNNDIALSAFFQAMTIYFASDEKPPEALLKLKVKELVTSILLGDNNPALSAYFRALISSEAPAIAPIMERNFNNNLPIETFAQMCHRSLSSFKREFQRLYGTSPGKWLLERRLMQSVSLLQTTQLSITEIAFECGFEDLSHFSRAFKEKFGQTPSAYRESGVFSA